MSRNKYRNHFLSLMTTTIVSLAVLATQALGQGFTVLHSFQGAEGSEPVAKLRRVGLATLYGLAQVIAEGAPFIRVLCE